LNEELRASRFPSVAAQRARRAPTFRSRAPLRLGLAGGGTDLSPYCDLYGGAVLNATIDRYAFASVTLAGGSAVTLQAGDLAVEEQAPAGALALEGPLQLHRAVYNRVVRDFHDGRPFGVRIATMIDAPPGSGLGSSSALVVALVDAFRAALELPLGRYDVAHLAFEIERQDLGLAGGRQDQYAAAFGGFNFIEFLANDRVIVNPLRLTAAVTNELQSSLVICFSGQSRASETIIAEQISSVRERDDEVLESMHRLKSTAIEMKHAVLQGDIDRVASLLDQAWVAKKRTAHNVTNPLIDRLREVGRESGAKAAKVSGAGGGGFMMFLVDPDARSGLLRALREAGASPDMISFSSEGVEAWQTSNAAG
jgi:D-glycero-alpha-D-manno-heptose-7-phosphate kinase